MADALFEHPRLAAVYDALDPDRNDLDVYALIVTELGAGLVLDLGCGTGTFQCRIDPCPDTSVRVSDCSRAMTGLPAKHQLQRPPASHHRLAIGVRCCHETRRHRGRQPVCVRGPGNSRGRSGRHASMRMFVLVLVPKTTAQRVPLGDAGGSPIAAR